jgi:hypothetical protein
MAAALVQVMREVAVEVLGRLALTQALATAAMGVQAQRHPSADCRLLTRGVVVGEQMNLARPARVVLAAAGTVETPGMV